MWRAAARKRYPATCVVWMRDGISEIELYLVIRIGLQRIAPHSAGALAGNRLRTPSICICIFSTGVFCPPCFPLKDGRARVHGCLQSRHAHPSSGHARGSAEPHEHRFANGGLHHILKLGLPNGDKHSNQGGNLGAPFPRLKRRSRAVPPYRIITITSPRCQSACGGDAQQRPSTEQ